MLDTVFKGYYKNSGSASIAPVGNLERFYYAFRDSFLVEPVFMLLSLATVVFYFRKIIVDKYRRYLLFGLLFNYLVMIVVVAAPYHSRWLAVFISLSIILSTGIVYEWLLEKSKIKFMPLAAIIVLIIPNLFFSAKWVYLLVNNTYIENLINT